VVGIVNSTANCFIELDKIALEELLVDTAFTAKFKSELLRSLDF
jgi:hypothetical protein